MSLRGSTENSRVYAIRVHSNYTGVESQAEVPYVIKTLEEWYSSCDGMLLTLESQVARANQAKAVNKEHRAKVNRQVSIYMCITTYGGPITSVS